jgi:hypothetical protein
MYKKYADSYAPVLLERRLTLLSWRAEWHQVYLL